MTRRIVHLGLGNFHRAHQAWWTAAVTGPDDPWEIVAYTGRRSDLARVLSAQGNRYTLIERSATGDRYERLSILAACVDGADMVHFGQTLADEATRVVTVTVTEAGYCLRPDGRLDPAHPAIVADRAVLAGAARAGVDRAGAARAGDDRAADARAAGVRAAGADRTAATGGAAPAGGSNRATGPAGAIGAVRTMPGRLLVGLDARRRAGGGPLAVVPCDNLRSNGRTLRAALLDLAGPGPMADWLAVNVSFVDTCVDRITPRATAADRAAVLAATGFADGAPVVAEPFRDWILSGDFPGGRPAWERAGARFVDAVGRWESRKLWLLNGAHSLLAYAGPRRGHTTVAAAFGDPVIAAAVERWWDETARLLVEDGLAAPDLDAYRQRLRDRFANPAIAHLLAQIAEDGEHKLRVRVVEPARRHRRAGRPATAAAHLIALWLASTGERDPGAGLSRLSPELAHDNDFAATVHIELGALTP